MDETPTRGHERALAVTVDRWGGVDIRPTRVFVWLGDRSSTSERLLPLGLRPRLLKRPRRRRHLQLGTVTISYLGNPGATLVSLAFNLLRRLVGRLLGTRGTEEEIDGTAADTRSHSGGSAPS